jgi:hypothetical protein
MARRSWLPIASSVTTAAGGLATLANWGTPFAPFVIVVGVVGLAVAGWDWCWEGQRRLPAWKRDRLAATINENGGLVQKVTILHADNCPECQVYADDFASSLALIGWTGQQPHSSLDEDQRATGVRIVVRDERYPPPTAVAVAAGMDAARIKYGWLSNPGMNDEYFAIYVLPRRR